MSMSPNISLDDPDMHTIGTALHIDFNYYLGLYTYCSEGACESQYFNSKFLFCLEVLTA